MPLQGAVVAIESIVIPKRQTSRIDGTYTHKEAKLKVEMNPLLLVSYLLLE